jgi:hypothetical protein
MHISKWQMTILIKAISFPLIVTLTSLIPKLNNDFLFCHGGLGWLLLALSFPWVLGVIFIGIRKQSKIDNKNHIMFGIVVLIVYLILSYPFALILQKGIYTAGVNMDMLKVWSFYMIPFSLFFE